MHGGLTFSRSRCRYPLTYMHDCVLLPCLLLAGRCQRTHDQLCYVYSTYKNASPPHQLTRGVPVNGYTQLFCAGFLVFFFLGHTSWMRYWSCLFKAEWGCCCICYLFHQRSIGRKRHVNIIKLKPLAAPRVTRLLDNILNI